MNFIDDEGSWLWISFASESRLIIDFTIGPRKQYVADRLVELTDKCLSKSKPLFISDGLRFYPEALLKKYGVWEEYPKTGKRGRPRIPVLVPDNNLRYSQVIKKREGGRLHKVDKQVIFGTDIDLKEISTSLLERQNLTFRQDNNRISRKTIGFSKKLKALYDQIRFYSTYFNFCRVHAGLMKKSTIKRTPAQESGIVKNKWTLKQLLLFKPTKTSTC